MRLGEKMRWSERALLQRYGTGLMPNQTEDDTRPVLEASPYYFAGMVDAADDLERIIRYIPDVKCAPRTQRNAEPHCLALSFVLPRARPCRVTSRRCSLDPYLTLKASPSHFCLPRCPRADSSQWSATPSTAPSASTSCSASPRSARGSKARRAAPLPAPARPCFHRRSCKSRTAPAKLDSRSPRGTPRPPRRVLCGARDDVRGHCAGGDGHREPEAAVGPVRACCALAGSHRSQLNARASDANGLSAATYPSASHTALHSPSLPPL